MNESDTRLKLIDPALASSSWTLEQIHTEYNYTAGEIVVRGAMVSRKKSKKVDYLLSYVPDVPIAVVEAKDTDHSVGAGMQQAMGYARDLGVRFAYSTNGHGFIEHDFTTGKERDIPMDAFPTAGELWGRMREAGGLDDKAAAQQLRRLRGIDMHPDPRLRLAGTQARLPHL